MSNLPLAAGPPGPPGPAAYDVPRAAWALAWSCLAAQSLVAMDRGVQSIDEGVVVSMALGALIVAWFSVGVLTGRTVRLVVVCFLFVVAVIVNAVSLWQAGWDGLTGWPVVALGTSLVDLACLAWFGTTDYFRQQRGLRRHRAADVRRPSLLPLLAIAFAVGLSGGLITPHPDNPLSVIVHL